MSLEQKLVRFNKIMYVRFFFRKNEKSKQVCGQSESIL